MIDASPLATTVKGLFYLLINTAFNIRLFSVKFPLFLFFTRFIIVLMEVYIEYVIIDNLVITGLISAMSYRVLKAHQSCLRILLASVLGTAAAVFYPLLSFNTVILVLIKIAVYAVLSFTLFFKRPYFIKGSLVFLLMTALMGGVMFMVGYVFYADAQKALTMPFYNFSIGLILAFPIFLYVIIRKLIAGVSKRRNISDYSYKIEFSVLGKTFNANGFLDSGNLLFDERSGLPVVVIGAVLTSKILGPDQFKMLLSNQAEKICKSARYVSFDTLGKNGKTLVIKPQNFRLYFGNGKNILKEVMLGLTFKGLGKDFDALLSPSLF